MVLISTSTEPSVYGLGGSGGIPSKSNVVLTYPMAASASVSHGDWVKLSDSTAGDIVRCTDTADSPIGVAFNDADNTYKSDGTTAGASGDKFCAVLRQGFAYVSGAVSSSGAGCDKAIECDDLLYLSASGAFNPYEGQTITSTTGGTLVARSFDSQVIAADTTPIYPKIRVYLDRLFKGTMS